MKSDPINTTKTNSHDYSTTNPLPKEDAKLLVLDFMSTYDVPMPPTVLHRGLRLKMRFTYSDETLLNYLDELVADKLVARVYPRELENRDIVPVDDPKVRSYYLITDAGREQLAE